MAAFRGWSLEDNRIPKLELGNESANGGVISLCFALFARDSKICVNLQNMRLLLLPP